MINGEGSARTGGAIGASSYVASAGAGGDSRDWEAGLLVEAAWGLDLDVPRRISRSGPS